MNRKYRKWLIIVSVFFIAFVHVGNVSAASSDFKNLTGIPKEGEVKISVESYMETEDGIVEASELTRIKSGDATSYIPVITNQGLESNLRLRVFAEAGDQKINILKYCYGFEDNWIKEDGWFYYKKPFEEGEKVQICSGFYFPDEWKWRDCNVLDITIEAEAVADEDMPAGSHVQTGDDSDIKPMLYLMIGAIAIMIAIAAGRHRREHGREDI